MDAGFLILGASDMPSTGSIATNLAPLAGKNVQIELVSGRTYNKVLLSEVNIDNIVIFGNEIVGNPGVSNQLGKMLPFTAISEIYGSQG
jgi:hypothetical protein